MTAVDGTQPGAQALLPNIITWLQNIAPARAFAVIGGVSMLVMLLITPPYMVPDESMHFKRAYSVSLAKIWPEYSGETPGFYGPASVQESINSHFQPGTYPAALDFPLEQLKRPLQPERELFIEFRPEAIYLPLGYLPQAAGILVGRAIGATPVEMVYLARLGNLAIAMLLIIWALRHLPNGHAPVLLVALLPMTEHLVASASADAMTIAGGMLFTAAMWRALYEDKWHARQVALIIFAAVLMCSTRWIYAPLLGIGAAAPFIGKRSSNKWIAVVAMGIAALAIVLVSSAWAQSMGSLAGSSRAGTDVQLHIGLLKSEPVSTGIYLVRSFIHDLPMLTKGVLGILGWNNLYLPMWLYGLVFMLFPLALVAMARSPNNWQRFGVRMDVRLSLWIAALLALVILLIQVGLFLVWTRVGAPYVEGVQGRYFQPLIPIACLALAAATGLYRLGAGWGRCAYAALLVGLAIASLATSVRILDFFFTVL